MASTALQSSQQGYAKTQIAKNIKVIDFSRLQLKDCSFWFLFVCLFVCLFVVLCFVFLKARKRYSKTNVTGISRF